MGRRAGAWGAVLVTLLGAAETAAAAEAASLSLAEGQVAPLSFERKVEQVAVSDPAVLAVRSAAPGRIEVVAQKGGAARLTVELEGGLSVAFDVKVAAAARLPRPPADPHLVELRAGEERRVEASRVVRAMVEDNGVARVRAEQGRVVVTALQPGTASMLLVEESGAQVEWTIRVKR